MVDKNSSQEKGAKKPPQKMSERKSVSDLNQKIKKLDTKMETLKNEGSEKGATPGKESGGFLEKLKRIFSR